MASIGVAHPRPTDDAHTSTRTPRPALRRLAAPTPAPAPALEPPPVFVKPRLPPQAVTDAIAKLRVIMQCTHTRMRVWMEATRRAATLDTADSTALAAYVSTAVTAILQFRDVHMSRTWVCLTAPTVDAVRGCHVGVVTPIQGRQGVPLFHATAMDTTAWVVIQAMHSCLPAWKPADFGLASDARHTCAYVDELRAAVPRGLLLLGLVEALMVRVPAAWRGALAVLVAACATKAAPDIVATDAGVRRIVHGLQQWHPVARCLGVPRSFVASTGITHAASAEPAARRLLTTAAAVWVLDTRFPGDAHLLHRLQAAAVATAAAVAPPIAVDVAAVLGVGPRPPPAPRTALTLVLPARTARLDTLAARTHALAPVARAVAVMDALPQAVAAIVARHPGHCHAMHALAPPDVAVMGAALWPPVVMRRSPGVSRRSPTDATRRVAATLPGLLWPHLTPPLYLAAAAQHAVAADAATDNDGSGWAAAATLVFAIHRALRAVTQQSVPTPPLFWTARLMAGRLDVGVDVALAPPVEAVAAAAACPTARPAVAHIATALVDALADTARTATGAAEPHDPALPAVYDAMRPLGRVANHIATHCAPGANAAVQRGAHDTALRRTWVPCRAPVVVCPATGEAALHTARHPWTAPALAAQAAAARPGTPAALTVQFPAGLRPAATFPGVFAQWLSRNVVDTRAAAQWALALARHDADGMGAGGTALLDRALALPAILYAAGGTRALWAADSDACVASLAVFLCPESPAAVAAADVDMDAWTPDAWLALGRNHTPPYVRPRAPHTAPTPDASDGNDDDVIPKRCCRRPPTPTPTPPALPAAPRVVERERSTGARPATAPPIARETLRRAERNTPGVTQAALRGATTAPKATLERLRANAAVARTLAAMHTPAVRTAAATAAARTANISTAALTASFGMTRGAATRRTAAFAPTASRTTMTARTIAARTAARRTAAATGVPFDPDAVPDAPPRGNALACGDRANIHYRRNVELLLLLRALEWRLYTGHRNAAALDAAAAAWPVDVQSAAAGVYAPAVREEAPEVGVMPTHVRVAAFVAAPNGRPLPPASVCTRTGPAAVPHALHSFSPGFLDTVAAVAPVMARRLPPPTP